jgi:hypothetical protein
MPRCACKVGRCPIPSCTSDCKRCGCACDGENPADALSRRRGIKRKRRGDSEAPPSRVQLRRSTRSEATVASQRITEVANIEVANTNCPEEADKQILSDESLWGLFELEDWRRQSLPSLEQRQSGNLHQDASDYAKKRYSARPQNTHISLPSILLPALLLPLVPYSTCR